MVESITPIAGLTITNFVYCEAVWKGPWTRALIAQANDIGPFV